MNRTYKVAKSLTRGVVVTSEKASSYQGKAVKTVIALAVASLVGSVGATALTGPVEHVTISSDQTTEVTTSVVGKWGEGDAADYTAKTSTVTVNGGKLTITGNSAGLNVGGVAIKSGTVILTDDTDNWDQNASTEGNQVPKALTNLGGYDSFEMTGGDVTLKNARLWIGSVDDKAYNTMTLSGGTLSLDNGGITGLANKTNDTFAGNTITLSGVELNAVKGDKNVVNSLNVEMSAGSINVAKDATLQISTYTRDSSDWSGAYSTLGGNVNFTGGTVVNKGTLNVQALKTTIDGTSFDNQGTLSFGSLAIKSGSISNAEGAELTVADATVTGGQVTNAGALTATTLTVQGGKVENAGKGVLDANTITIEKNGVLNTTYTKDTFKWNGITVKDNGVLNLDALNSRHDGKTIGTKDTDGNVLAGDRLLINAGTINLAGGELQVAGTKYEGDLKIGRSETNAKVTVTSDYSFNKVEFGSSKKITGDNTASTLTIGSDDKTGKLTIADLDLTYGAVTVNDGSTLTLGTVSAVDTGTLTNDGYLLTGISNLVNKDGTATDFANKALKGTGSVVETSITGEYSLEDLKKYAALVKDQELIIKNGTLAKKADGSNHTLSDVDGLVVFNSTVTNSTTTASVTNETTVGALAFTGDDVKGKDVTISGNLQLTGVNGEIITGVDADKTITIDSTVDQSNDGVMFGAEDDDLFSFAPVSVNNKVIVNDDKQLTTKGTVTFAKAVDLKTSGKIEARNGVFTFDSIKGGSVYNDGGSVIVKNAAPAAASGKSTATETVTYDKAFALDTQYAGNNGAFFTFGQNKASKASTEALIRQYADLAADAEIGASLYVSERYDLANGGIALGAASASTTKGTLSAAAGSYIVLDMGSIASKNYDPKTSGVFQGVASGNGSVAGTILLTDLTADGFVKDEKTGAYSLDLGTNVTVTDKKNVITDADFYKVEVSESTVTLSADQEELDKLKDLGMNNAWLVEHDIKEMTNSGNFFANALIYGNEALDAYYDNAEAEWKKIAEAAKIDATDKTTAEYKAYWAVKDGYVAESEIVGSNMAVFGGAFTTALDVNDQVTAAVSRRTSAQRAEGFTPWVDVFGTTNEAKRLYGNGAGYEADIYGAVLGFDYTAACGGTLGVAFNVGQADSNSVGTGVKVDNDADFYGFSLYGAQTFGDFNVKADLGYTQISNDLSSTGAFGTVKESLDSNVFTFGLGTEYLAKFGALNITPHAGIRLSRIDMDDSKYGADYDAMTIYQLPLGVAFSGNFDVNGWKLAPMVDLSVVPAFGDKDAVASFYGNDVTTRVVDTNPIQATLGVSAQNGAWTFGLNYGLTAGGDDRMNNAFNANLRYSF
ncbi:autotransporter domain-containing protein [Sutterella wadsworthensis]|uniref:autotransporter domain-containing protein n=1 Tax=Sutterella wadsworthensis TaxID=40545 RepID=UPI0013F65B6F|nr:autotransporter outer membrane beta-barrel domain-containing protein [Sutterella wadsworthensis]